MSVEQGMIAQATRKSEYLCRKTSNWLAVCVLGIHALIAADAVYASAVGTTAGQISVSPTGAAGYSIPIITPPGIGGIEPKLALGYSSQASNGLVGVGWSLSGLSAISRCSRTLIQDGAVQGVSDTSSDKFCLDGQRLIAISGNYGANGTQYRTERESYSRITSYGVGTGGPLWFKVETKGGQVLEYGHTTDSAIPLKGKTAINVWALNKVSDIKGNYLTITNEVDDVTGQFHPIRIDYTGNALAAAPLLPNKSVRFEYETRPDNGILYTRGSFTKPTVRLSKIKTYVGSTRLVKEYRLQYEPSPSTDRSRLISITECDGASPAICLNPTVLAWQEISKGFTQPAEWITGMYNATDWAHDSVNPRMLADVNGDGLSDIVGFSAYDVIVALGNKTGFATPTVWLVGQFGDGDTFVVPPIISGKGVVDNWGTQDQNPRMMVDVNQDGKSDIVGFGCCGVIVSYAKATGDGFMPPIDYTIGMFGNSNLGGGWGSQSINPRSIADVNGDGLPDIVGFSSNHVYVALGNGAGFGTPTVWLENRFGNGNGWGTQDQNPRIVTDLNGDGKADILGFTCCGTAVSYAKPTGDGFLDSIYVTGGFFGNASQGGGWGSYSVNPRELADVNADGLPDIVGFSSTHVYVSLNTGTGFATPTVWLQNQFGDSDKFFDPNADVGTDIIGWGNQDENPRMVVDVNGDGRADILGFSCCGTAVSYAKASGDGFMPPVFYTQGMFGSTFEGSAWGSNEVTPRKLADVDGNGFPDIVGFSSRGVVVSKSNGPVPDLVTAITNGLGATTAISYKPMTDTSVYSKGSGAVYPFMDLISPANIVSSVSSSNGIGGYFVSNYKYVGAKSYLRGGGFLGVNQVTTTDTLTGIYTTSTYAQGATCSDSTGHADPAYPNCLHSQGLILSAKKYTASGKLLYNAVNKWSYATDPGVMGAQYHSPQLAQNNEIRYELASDGTVQGAVITTTTTCNIYDAYGNATYIGVWNANLADCAAPPSKTGLFVKETTNTYSNNITKWFLGRLTRVDITSSVPYEIPVATTRTALPTLTIASLAADKSEGNAGATTPFTFTLSRGGNTSIASSVDWAVTGSGTVPADAADFTGATLPSGAAYFAAGETSKTITVNVNGESTSEYAEGFTVTLSNPLNLALGTSTADGVIRNDDLPPISIAQLSADKAEGNTGTTSFTFRLTRSGDLSASSAVDWDVTGNGTYPVQAADFAGSVFPSGTVSFVAGESTKTVTIGVVANAQYEPTERFAVTLSNQVGAVLGTASAVGIIRNDDPLAITIAAAKVNYDLRSELIATGWDQASAIDVNVSINSGVIVKSNSTAIAAFTISGTYPAGMSITVNNAGSIIGQGGAGGDGGATGYAAPWGNGKPGNAGGPAFSTSTSVTVSNTGTIAGGGGGGGGGSSIWSPGLVWNGGASGGGGAGGVGGAAGGGGGDYWTTGLFTGDIVGYGQGSGARGAAGTYSTAGAGGKQGYGVNEWSGMVYQTGFGGAGGGWGQAGTSGGTGNGASSGIPHYGGQPGGQGGAAGAATIGNSNITWSATGTRLGALN